MVITCLLAIASAPTYGSRLGVEVSDHPSALVDLARRTREFQRVDREGRAPIDANGWPTSDFATVLMDDRPAMAWAPPMDDPEQRQPDESGSYTIAFTGRADVAPTLGSPVRVGAMKYDPARNVTVGSVTLPKGAPALIALSFTHTRRGPNSTDSDGITGFHFLRPGYSLTGTPTFTKEFLRALAPFSYLRVMGWMDTNYQAGYYGDKGHHLIQWEDRTKPTDAILGFQGLRPGTHGVGWDAVIELANQTHKDLWINVPVSATGTSPDDQSSYVYQLAKLLKSKLHSDARIYVEHSNEVWNFGFSQYIWNKLAAIDEVSQGGSVLNRDGSKDQEQWARRRHALRLYQISRIFERVFGPGSLNKRVLPIYAAWTIQPDWYAEVLGWMQSNFGPPNNYFFSLSETAYLNDQRSARTATPLQVVEAMRRDSIDTLKYTSRLKAIADQYGLKLSAYEAGPDNGGGSTVNIGARILANRTAAMGDLVIEHFKNRFFDVGGDLATYFALSSSASRYGCWGATEDYRDLNTPKYRAILKLVAMKTSGASDARSGAATSIPSPSNLSVEGGYLVWKPIPDATYTVWYTTGGNYIVAASGLREPRTSLSRLRQLAGQRSITIYVTATRSGVTSPPSEHIELK